MTRSLFNALMAGAAMSFTISTASLPSFASSDDTNMMLIFDASGSMKKKLDGGENRLDAAKRAMSDVLGNMEEGINLGLTMYGHRVRKQCTDIELVAPIGSEDAGAINQIIQGVEAKGETPIADSIRQAVKSFKAFKGADNRIVLVTDGIEECGGNVCEAAQFAKDAGVDIKIDVVGFTLNDEQKNTVACVSEITGGKYYDASDASSLNTSLRKAVKKSSDDTADEAPPSGKINLIAAANGGTLVTAPNADWKRLNDGVEEFFLGGTSIGDEGVFAFKDGKSATIESLEWAILNGNDGNLKSLEVLTSDSLEKESFTSIGGCKFENVLMLQSPYHTCTLTPTTAKYVKIRVLDSYFSYDNRAGNVEMRIFGQLEGGNPPDAGEKTEPSQNPATKAVSVVTYAPPLIDGSRLGVCEKPDGQCGDAPGKLFCEKMKHSGLFAQAGVVWEGSKMIETGDFDAKGISSVTCMK